MRLIGKAVLLGLCVPLAACGGGGEVSSTPAPAPAPSPAPVPSPSPTPSPTPTPAPAPGTIGALTGDHTFATQGTTTNVALSTTDGIVDTTSASGSPLTIKYDAVAQTYTVASDGRSQSFGPTEAETARWAGEKRYSKSLSNGSDYLTLVTNPYSDPQYTNKYVGMGYWQRNAVQGTDQQTYFSTFTYGFDTAAAGMPKTGAAHWLTDIFGLLTIPNRELLVVQGLGDFVVDFQSGAFNVFANLDESNVVTQGGTSGSLRFRSGGFVSSGSKFSGLVSYYGSYAPLYGTLNGSFYGPNADEVGASFQASGSGAVLTGAFTGQRTDFGGSDSSGTIHNVSLTAPIADEGLTGVSAGVFWVQDDGSATFHNLLNGLGSIYQHGAYLSKSGLTQAMGYTINPSDQVNDSRANFTTYQTTLAGDPATVSIYKIGSTNPELQLTYSSFATLSFSHREPGDTSTTYRTDYSTFGVETSPELLAARTGSASYSGVAYGHGVSSDTTQYDIGGTSHFDVNFSSASYSGWLQLQGTDQHGVIRDFGQWTFARNDGFLGAAPLTGPGANDPGSSILPDFFGPTGQEIGAAIHLRTGWPPSDDSVYISGVAMAKQQ